MMADGVGARKKEETPVRGYFRSLGGKGATLQQQLRDGERWGLANGWQLEREFRVSTEASTLGRRNLQGAEPWGWGVGVGEGIIVGFGLILSLRCQ